MKASRRDRRAGSQRERWRRAGETTDKFLALYERGVSRGAMAQVLGLSTEEVAELCAIAEEHQPETVEAGGGGG